MPDTAATHPVRALVLRPSQVVALDAITDAAGSRIDRQLLGRPTEADKTSIFSVAAKTTIVTALIAPCPSALSAWWRSSCVSSGLDSGRRDVLDKEAVRGVSHRGGDSGAHRRRADTRGRELVTRCPFHEDTRSLGVNVREATVALSCVPPRRRCVRVRRTTSARVFRGGGACVRSGKAFEWHRRRGASVEAPPVAGARASMSMNKASRSARW